MVFDEDSGEWVNNSEYIPLFSDGSGGTEHGLGHKLFPSTQDRVYCASDTSKSAPQMVIEVPIKGYRKSVRGSDPNVTEWTTNTDIMYDVDVSVFWQPYGESKEVKLGIAGTSIVEGIPPGS